MSLPETCFFLLRHYQTHVDEELQSIVSLPEVEFVPNPRIIQAVAVRGCRAGRSCDLACMFGPAGPVLRS